MTDEFIVTIFIIISFLIGAFFLIRYILICAGIKKYSKLFAELTNLNNNYISTFFKIDKKKHIYFRCNSLQQYKNNCNGQSISDYICGYIRESGDNWNELHSNIKSNKTNLDKYLAEYEIIKQEHRGKSYNYIHPKTFLFSEEQYIVFEEKYCQRKQLKPRTTFKIITQIHYTSPKGRNRYSSTWDSDADAIFNKILGQKLWENTKKYQRSLMTDSLRYDILRRDNFTCQLCGSSKGEGAKLEVDHIHPVSKGGKTAPSNLRTLCRECNQGKKAKIE